MWHLVQKMSLEDWNVFIWGPFYCPHLLRFNLDSDSPRMRPEETVMFVQVDFNGAKL